ncbi:MAG: hypothetical protein K2J47_00995 [Ruminococcus sp.]|nr:hypothetical protein [Ruminococcus sp.]
MELSNKYEYISILRFIFIDCEKYLIWHNDDKGKDVVEIRNNKILVFDTLESAEKFAGDDCECWEYNISELEKFIHAHNKNFDCKIILDFWNIFNDILYSFGEKIPDERTKRSDRCYNKLFFGNNLPAITPDGECYIPVFTRKERKNIRRILSYGIDFMYRNME